MEAKGLRVNMGKTKIMVSGVNLQTLKDSGKYPCSVGSNSIYCAGCSHWVHKKCSGVIGSLKLNPDYRCSRCKGTARPIDIQTLLRYNRLRWFGHHIIWSCWTAWTWKTEEDMERYDQQWSQTLKLSRAGPANRMEWRKKLRRNIGAVRPTLSGTDTLNEWWWWWNSINKIIHSVFQNKLIK